MKTLSTALLLAVPTLALAVEPPTLFEEGDVISAESMNDNFEELYQAILDLEEELDDVVVDIDLNQSGLADLDSSVSSFNGSLAGLQTDVDAAEQAIEQAVPSGTLAYFDMSTCPSGWTAVTSAHGRALVARPSGGLLGGTSGAPLSDRESRSHRHTVDPQSQTFTTNSAGSHNHQWLDGWDSYTSNGGDNGVSIHAHNNTSLGRKAVLDLSTTADYYTDNDGDHAHTVSIDLGSSDSSLVSSTLPYVQYTLCERT